MNTDVDGEDDVLLHFADFVRTSKSKDPAQFSTAFAFRSLCGRRRSFVRRFVACRRPPPFVRRLVVVRPPSFARPRSFFSLVFVVRRSFDRRSSWVRSFMRRLSVTCSHRSLFLVVRRSFELRAFVVVPQPTYSLVHGVKNGGSKLRQKEVSDADTLMLVVLQAMTNISVVHNGRVGSMLTEFGVVDGVQKVQASIFPQEKPWTY